MNSALIARAGQFVWIIEQNEGGFFLYQFGPGGSVWDTWHLSVEAAKAQAAFAMHAIVGPWNAVPTGVSDLQAFGKAARNSN
jgi:hypothetical protein